MSGPLTGMTILVTRPTGQEKGLIQQLADLGAMTLHWPAIEIQPPTDWTSFDAVFNDISRFDWIVFTSANGVRMCFERMQQLRLPATVLDSVGTAAIGPATARALRRQHQSPKVISNPCDSNTLAEALTSEATGLRMLLIRAEQCDSQLRIELDKFAQVDEVYSYRQVETREIPSDVEMYLLSGDVDIITLTSANIAKAVISKLVPKILNHIRAGRTQIITNSTSTSQTVAEFGLQIAVQAETSLDDGMVAAVLSRDPVVKEGL